MIDQGQGCSKINPCMNPVKKKVDVFKKNSDDDYDQINIVEVVTLSNNFSNILDYYFLDSKQNYNFFLFDSSNSN